MKLIIAGGRNINVPYEFIEYIRQAFGLRPSEIVSGGAQGIDYIGERFAEKFNKPLKVFKANWDLNGRAAGHIRNKEMAEYADALLLIWDGESRGSKNMKENMLKLNKPIYELVIKWYNTDEAF